MANDPLLPSASFYDGTLVNEDNAIAAAALLAAGIAARVAPQTAAPIARYGLGIELGPTGSPVGLSPLAVGYLAPQPFGFVPASVYGLEKDFYLTPGIAKSLPDFLPGVSEARAKAIPPAGVTTAEVEAEDRRKAAVAGNPYQQFGPAPPDYQRYGGASPDQFTTLSDLANQGVLKGGSDQPASANVTEGKDVAQPKQSTAVDRVQAEFDYWFTTSQNLEQTQLADYYAQFSQEVQAAPQGSAYVLAAARLNALKAVIYQRQINPASFGPALPTASTGQTAVQGTAPAPPSVPPILGSGGTGRAEAKREDGTVPGGFGGPVVPPLTNTPGGTPGQPNWQHSSPDPSAMFPDSFFAHRHGDP